MAQKTFACTGAGQWFPGEKSELGQMVDHFLSGPSEKLGTPVAVIAPHAGYVYSGAGAGYSYRTLKGKNIKRVVIFGPSHHSSFRGISALSGYNAYETPLGEIPIDVAGVEQLKKDPVFGYFPEAHLPEHSVENQIPFIQRVLPETAIIPCVVGYMEDSDFIAAGKSVKNLLDDSTIIVASSDFTHYGQNFDFVPFKTDIRNNLEKLDTGAIRFIEKCDRRGFLGYVDETGATICGRNAIGVMLETFAGKATGKLLKYFTSSDDSNDFSHTVCYASIAMSRKD